MAPTSRQSAAPSARHSLAPGATPGTSTTSPKIALPTYEKPVAPLNADARLKLSQLLDDTYSLRKSNDTLDKAARFLNDMAGNLNEQLHDRTDLLSQRKRKRAQATRDGSDNAEDDEAFEREEALLKEHEAKVTNMTKRLDISVRKTIEGYAANINLDAVLKDLGRTSNLAAAATVEHAATQHATQASQRSQARRRVADDEDEDVDSDGEVTQIPATAAQSTPGAQQAATPAPPVPALTPAFTANLSDAADRYTAQSLTTRYASHNTYVDFRKIVHDALHPDQNIPLPHANTWFAAEEGREAPAPGDTSRTGEDDDGEDIAIARVTLSTKCPLTLVQLVDPVTSKVCKHSFERFAISEMIKTQRPPPRARGQPAPQWTASVECPVGGCDKRIREQDLEVDAVVVRQIKRVQRAREREEEEEGEDGEHAQTVGSQDSEVVDVDVVGTARSVKTERVRATLGEEIEDVDDEDEEEGMI